MKRRKLNLLKKYKNDIPEIKKGILQYQEYSKECFGNNSLSLTSITPIVEKLDFCEQFINCLSLREVSLKINLDIGYCENDHSNDVPLAVHEVGHAIIAWNLGWEPELLTLGIGDIDSDGEYKSIMTLADSNPVMLNNSQINVYKRCDLMVKTAGAVAENIILPHYNNYCAPVAGDDIIDANKLALSLTNSDKKHAHALILEVAFEAQCILKQNKASLMYLSEILLKESFIQGKDVMIALNQSCMPRGKDLWRDMFP